MQKDKKKYKTEMKRFGFNLAVGLNILGCIMFYRGKDHFIWFSFTGGLVLILSILCPFVLTPFKELLDDIILWFGRLVNIISLLLVFFLIFTPAGILLRLFKKDILNDKPGQSGDSYWIKRRECGYTPESYERMG